MGSLGSEHEVLELAGGHVIVCNFSCSPEIQLSSTESVIDNLSILQNMAPRVFVLLLALGVLAGCQACSPVPGWKPMTVPELVPLAPIVADVNIISVVGDWGGQNATADVKCVVKNTSGAPMPKQVNITGFGASSACLTGAEVGGALAFLDVLDLSTTPPMYTLVYSDIHAGTKPATPDNLAAAKSVMALGELHEDDGAC